MKKFFVLLAAACLSLSLAGCSAISDATGLDLNGYTDALLNSVAWPNGSSVSDFKAFVSGVVGDLNLDSAVNSVDIEKAIEDALTALNVDIIDKENAQQIEDTIRQVLGENGVDTEGIEIDVEKWITASATENDTEVSDNVEEDK